MRYLTRMIIFAILFLPITYTYAAVPHLINYQGRLTNKTGLPLQGTYTMTFKVYDAQTAGTLLGAEVFSNLVIDKGMVNVLLGDGGVVTGIPRISDLAFDAPYFLEIIVGDEVMSPRQRITSAAYAIRAEKADDANTVGSVGVSATPAANKLLPLDSAGKLPVSALKVYDSGWFYATKATDYLKTHNLGTNKLLVSLYYAGSPLGDSMTQVIMNLALTSNGEIKGSQIQNITSTTLDVITGLNEIVLLSGGGKWTALPTGYLRVIAIALE